MESKVEKRKKKKEKETDLCHHFILVYCCHGNGRPVLLETK